MDFTFDEEQDALRDAVRGLLGKAYGDFETRRQTTLKDPGFSAGTWAKLAEMGLLGLPFSDDDGGVGAGPIEVGIVAEEIGRVIAPEPYLTTVTLAGGVVAALGSDEQRAEILGGLTAGEVVPAVAHDEPGGRWTAAATGVRATSAADSWVLDGVKEPVIAAGSATVLLVSAALPDGGTGVFVVDPADAQITTYRTPDGTRAGRVTLDGAPGVALGDGGDATAAIAAAYDTTRVIAAQQAVGAMEVMLRTTAGYLNSREQFGVPLKKFQALTFRAADLYVTLELARSIAQWALMVHADPDTDAALRHTAATRAWAQVAKASRHVGQEAIQLHGGIAMTAEYSVGSYTAHLAGLESLLGDARHHLGALAGDVASYAEVDPLG